MSIVIIGGPKRGKTTLARLMSGSTTLPHRCSDPQRYCPRDVVGVPNDLQYDEISSWVCEHWLKPPSNLLVEGVHAARALQKYLAGRPQGDTGNVKRVIYCALAVDRAELPGQRAQTTKVERTFKELRPQIAHIVEFWGPDGRGGFREIPQVCVTELSAEVVRRVEKRDRQVKRNRGYSDRWAR